MIPRLRKRVYLKPRPPLSTMQNAHQESITSRLPGAAELRWFSFGRDALAHLFGPRSGRNREVWVPEYMCPLVLRLLRDFGWTVCAYPLSSSLEPDWSYFRQDADPTNHGSVLVLLDFLGFALRVPQDTRDVLRSRFDVVVRDSAQGLPHPDFEIIMGTSSGHAVFSLRKSLPVADVCVLISASEAGGTSGTASLGGPHTKTRRERRSKRREAFASFELGLFRYPRLRLVPGVRQVEQLLKREKTPGLAPSRASSVMIGCFDLDIVAQRRNANAAYLAHRLERFALYRRVPPCSSPNSFPIVVSERDRIARRLERLGVETTTLWGPNGWSGNSTEQEVRRLAGRLLCLPVHQDLTCGELQYIADSVEAVCSLGSP